MLLKALLVILIPGICRSTIATPISYRNGDLADTFISKSHQSYTIETENATPLNHLHRREAGQPRRPVILPDSTAHSIRVQLSKSREIFLAQKNRELADLANDKSEGIYVLKTKARKLIDAATASHARAVLQSSRNYRTQNAWENNDIFYALDEFERGLKVPKKLKLSNALLQPDMVKELSAKPRTTRKEMLATWSKMKGRQAEEAILRLREKFLETEDEELKKSYERQAREIMDAAVTRDLKVAMEYLSPNNVVKHVKRFKIDWPEEFGKLYNMPVY